MHCSRVSLITSMNLSGKFRFCLAVVLFNVLKKCRKQSCISFKAVLPRTFHNLTLRRGSVVSTSEVHVVAVLILLMVGRKVQMRGSFRWSSVYIEFHENV